MNFVGKLFTLLILILSVAFLSVAIMVSASHRNWDAIRAEHQAEADRYQKLLTEAQSSSTTKKKLLEAEKTSRAMQIVQLEALRLNERRNLDNQRAALEAEETRAQQILFDAPPGQSDLLDAETELKQKETEIETLSAENVNLAAEIAAARAQAIALTNQLNDAEAKLEAKRTLAEDMRRQIGGN